nr:MAG TPA: hypothetical protein [Caudoviricetes sp.]
MPIFVNKRLITVKKLFIQESFLHWISLNIRVSILQSSLFLMSTKNSDSLLNPYSKPLSSIRKKVRDVEELRHQELRSILILWEKNLNIEGY